MGSDTLRIALISLHTSPFATPGRADAGGMNVVVRNTAIELARRGHAVDIYTRRTDPAEPRVRAAAPGVRLIALTAGPHEPLPKSRMEATVGPFRSALSAALAADGQARPDVVHSHHWFSGVAALPVSQELGVAHVQSFHSVAAPAGTASLASGEPAESAGRIRGEAFIATDSTRIVAVSAFERDLVVQRYGADPARIRVVHPGVADDFFAPDVPPRTAPYLLFAARLQPLKGADLALEAFARVRAERPDLRFVFAGAASPDFAAYPATLRARIAELGIADSVDFVGAQSPADLARLMRGAELFLFPSWSESFGLVALEAQASGVPVLAWRGAGGLREAIAPGTALVPTRDPADWAERIVSLLGDDADLSAARAAAREFARAHSWRASVDRLVEVYGELA